AFDAGREGLDAGQRLQAVELVLEALGGVGCVAAGDLGVERGEERLRLIERLPLQHLGHERGRGGRDGAAAPLERDVGDAVAVEPQINRDAVAAERVVAVREMARMLERAEIPRMPAVIQDDVLVKLAEVHYRANIFCAATIASASASTSRS